MVLEMPNAAFLARRSVTILDAINTPLVRLLRNQVEPEPFADHTGEKAADGMLLPFCCGNESSDRGARR